MLGLASESMTAATWCRLPSGMSPWTVMGLLPLSQLPAPWRELFDKFNLKGKLCSKTMTRLIQQHQSYLYCKQTWDCCIHQAKIRPVKTVQFYYLQRINPKNQKPIIMDQWMAPQPWRVRRRCQLRPGWLLRKGLCKTMKPISIGSTLRWIPNTKRETNTTHADPLMLCSWQLCPRVSKCQDVKDRRIHLTLNWIDFDCWPSQPWSNDWKFEKKVCWCWRGECIHI